MASTKAKKDKKKRVYADAKKRVQDHEAGWKPIAYKVPEGMKVFKFTEDKLYSLDIIPFIAGEGNPYAKPGQMTYERTYYVHPLGPDGEKYGCNRENFGKPCPVCTKREKFMMQPGFDKDIANGMRPKERQLWLVINRAKKSEGVQFFEAAHYGKGAGFGEMLDNKIDAAKEGSPQTRFFYLDDGMTLEVKCKKDSFKKATFFKPTNMELVPRKSQYDEDMIDDQPCLDECILEADQNEMKKYLDGFDGEEPEQEEDEPVKKNKAKGRVEEDEELDEEEEENEEEEATAHSLGIKKGSNVKHKKYGVCTVVHISTDGTSLRLEDEDEEVHKGVAPSECTVIKAKKKVEEDDDDDDDDDEPVKKKGKKKVVEEEDDDEEEDDSEDDDDVSDDDDEDDSSDDDGDSGDDDEDDESGNDDDDEDDEDEKPVKKKGKAPAKGKKKVVEEEEDDEEDDDIPFDEDEEEDDDEEEEEKPAPKKKKKK
jgi:hypothetical protein